MKFYLNFCFLPHPLEQIGDSQLGGPLLEVWSVKRIPLKLQYANHVVPLSFGNFLPESKPFELTQYDILGRGKEEVR